MSSNPDPTDLTRREALRRGLASFAVLAGAGVVMEGCAGRSQRRAGAELPTISWPEGRLARLPSATPRSRTPVVPAPMPGWDGTIILRSTWAKGAPFPPLMTRARPYTRITVHHDGMDAFTSTSRGDAADRLEHIRRAHRGRKFGDIGYHYLIDPAGRVWGGRPLVWQGAHVKAQNEGNLGVCVLGNFERQRPTSMALAALDGFVKSQMQFYRVPPVRLRTHQELAPTLCPGRNLQSYMVLARKPRGVFATA